MAVFRAYHLGHGLGSHYNIPQALDPNNSPGWDTESSAGAGAASRLPLFVKTVLSVPPSPQQEIQVHRGSIVVYS